MKKREQGFTLIEIIIAVTLTGIILLAVFIFFDISFSTQERVEEHSSWEQQWRVFETMLQRDLNRLFSSLLYSENKFKGEYQRVEWLILTGKGLKEISYYFDSLDNEIVRTERSLNSNDRKKELRFFTDLDINLFEINYYDGQAKYWRTFWSYQDNLIPAVLRFRIESPTKELPSPLLKQVFLNKEFIY